MMGSNNRIGIVGIGAMGKGLLYQSSITPGIRCVAVCDRDISRAIDALEWLKLPYKQVATAQEMHAAIEEGKVAVCADGGLIASCAHIDSVVEASSGVASALAHCMLTLEHKKNLILMNSEIDLTFGPLLMGKARENGVVCSSCDGDQYGVLKRIIDDITLWGFDVVMAGNIKGFLDRYVTPETIVAEADKRKLDYRMCTSYTDGSKLNIEMAIVANAYGMAPSCTGMRGPRIAQVNDVFSVFDFDALWKDRTPVVDYILGAEPGGGVFVIGHCSNPYQKDMLAYYKMGSGPYYLFYRPYHLCHIEGMAAVLAAARGETFMQPTFGLRTNVYAYAKRDLQPGDVLDGLGGFTCYGHIETTEANRHDSGIPICLAHDLTVREAIKKDAKILLRHLHHDPARTDFAAYGAALNMPTV